MLTKLTTPRLAVVYPDEWLNFELTVDGSRIVATIDGKEVANYTDPDGTYTKGHIALTAFTKETKIEFRKIEIKELSRGAPAGPAPAAVLAPLRDEVAARTRARDNAGTRYEVGTINKLAFLAAEIELTEARIKLGGGTGPTAVASCWMGGAAHRQSERDLVAIRVRAGADPGAAALDAADARLAAAKARRAAGPPKP